MQGSRDNIYRLLIERTRLILPICIEKKEKEEEEEEGGEGEGEGEGEGGEG